MTAKTHVPKVVFDASVKAAHEISEKIAHRRLQMYSALAAFSSASAEYHDLIGQVAALADFLDTASSRLSANEPSWRDRLSELATPHLGDRPCLASGCCGMTVRILNENVSCGLPKGHKGDHIGAPKSPAVSPALVSWPQASSKTLQAG